MTKQVRIIYVEEVNSNELKVCLKQKKIFCLSATGLKIISRASSSSTPEHCFLFNCDCSSNSNSSTVTLLHMSSKIWQDFFYMFTKKKIYMLNFFNKAVAITSCLSTPSEISRIENMTNIVT